MKRRAAPSSVPQVSGRDFVAAGLSGLLVGVAVGERTAIGQASAGRKLRVAAINTIFRLRSHAYHIVGRMVHGFQKDGVHHQPNLQVVRMYNDQSPPDDLSRGFCDRHGIELVKTPAEALGGAAGLDVDAMAYGGHGDYPVNKYGQILIRDLRCFRRWWRSFAKAGGAAGVLR